jgi:hypothetical protein
MDSRPRKTLIRKFSAFNLKNNIDFFYFLTQKKHYGDLHPSPETGFALAGPSALNDSKTRLFEANDQYF